MTVRRRRRRASLPFPAWPDDDRFIWRTLFASASPLDSGGPLSHWSVTTSRFAMASYACWLGFCKRKRKSLLSLAPDARVRPDIVALYISELQARTSPVTTALRIDRLWAIARAIAPERDWRWLRLLARRLRNRAVPARDKHLKIRHPRELFDLGVRLMEQADAHGGQSVANAVRFRTGMVIALLATRPIRSRSLRGLRPGDNLVRAGDRFWLALGPADTKSRLAYDAPLSDVLNDALERYLSYHRPRLLSGGDSDFLLVSAGGRPISQTCLARNIAEATKAAFGKAISPHLFRDCVATATASDDPDHAEIIAPLLGHTSTRTAERHYIHAQTQSVSHQYQVTIQAMRKQRPRHRGPASVTPADVRRAMRRMLTPSPKPGGSR